MLEEENQAYTNPFDQQEFAEVIKSYIAKDAIELNLRVGDIVRLLSNNDSEWFKAELNGDIGLVNPVLCCKKISKEEALKKRNAKRAVSPPPSVGASPQQQPQPKPAVSPPPEVVPQPQPKRAVSPPPSVGASPQPQPKRAVSPPPSVDTVPQPQAKPAVMPIVKPKPVLVTSRQNNANTEAEIQRLKQIGLPQQYRLSTRPPNIAGASKKLMIRDRDDEKGWVKIMVSGDSFDELIDVIAKRLRIDKHRIGELQTCSVLDDQGKPDKDYIKVLKDVETLRKLPNGTFLQVVLSAAFDLKKTLALYFSWDDKPMAELLAECQNRKLDSSKALTKQDLVDLLQDNLLNSMTLPQVIKMSEALMLDCSKCESKQSMILFLKNSLLHANLGKSRKQTVMVKS